MEENEKRENRKQQNRKQQDKRERELLRAFDKELFSYTGQIAWLLPGIFSFCALIMAAIPVSEFEKGDPVVFWGSLYIASVLASVVLMPYIWSNDSFTRRNSKRDRTYNMLRYLPLARKNYIYVRMGYLFRFLWKLTAASFLIQGIVAIAIKEFHIENFLYVIFSFLMIPLLVGWLNLKASVKQ